MNWSRRTAPAPAARRACLSAATFRSTQQSIVALDIIALMDALAIEKAILACHDGGARTHVRKNCGQR